jgi:hypothetical protein
LAAIQLDSREGVDLAGRVGPLEEASWTSARGIAANGDHVSAAPREFALDADKASVDIKDQSYRSSPTGLATPIPSFTARVDDRRLGNNASLIGRELDPLDRSHGLGWAVSGLDGRF